MINDPVVVKRVKSFTFATRVTTVKSFYDQIVFFSHHFDLILSTTDHSDVRETGEREGGERGGERRRERGGRVKASMWMRQLKICNV